MKSSDFFPTIEKIVWDRMEKKSHTVEELAFGFPISIVKPNYKEKVLDVFLARKVHLTAELAAKGIVPLAILPYGAWQSICEKAGLLRFEHINKDGITHTNIKPDKIPYKAIEAAVSKLSLWKRSKAREQAILEFQKSYIRPVENIFPLGRDLPRSMQIGDAKGRDEVRVIFMPNPPDSFKNTLTKLYLAGTDVKIAAVPEAIKVEELGWNSDYQKSFDEYLRTDPIIYGVDEGRIWKLVYIMGQFGDFPEEKAVLDYLVSDFNVLNLFA